MLFSLSSVLSEEPGDNWTLTRLKSTVAVPHTNSSVSSNPIDRFVIHELEKQKLQLSKVADRQILLKRLTYDVTGLHPTSEERDAFLSDESPNAIEKVIDRLLNSPAFGERWAQHWLDIVRYSDTEGYKWDRDRPEAYRYRDYVIRAFNSDIPYDEFLRQQIAGDELDPQNPDALVATGFFRIHPEEANASDYRQVRQDILNDVTDVFGMTFMGLTMGCARCHDHKFDPITQEDYFHLQAFFAPLIQRDDLELMSQSELKAYQLRLQTWENASSAIRREMDGMVEPIRKTMFEEIIVAFDADTQLALRTPTQKRTPVQKQLATLGSKQLERRYGRLTRRLNPQQRARYDELQQKLSSLEPLKPSPRPMAMGVADVGITPPPTYRLANGNYLKPKEQIEPDYPECLDESDPKIQAPKARPESTGRRSALARWMTQPDHPLTAKVIVNRIWQHYFGRGLIATPNDFGLMGGNPSHPELLEFLAIELVKNGWKMKALHRLILTSAVYQQSSNDRDNPSFALAKKQDPDIRLLWQARLKRRDGESLRDGILQTTESLNPRMYGASSLPLLPKQLEESRYSWYPDDSITDQNRRSVYLYHRRNLLYPLFQAFDQPDRINSCPVRNSTTTAPQVLVMLNGEFALEQARLLAGKLLQTSTGLNGIPDQIYFEVLGRHPSSIERVQAENFLKSQIDIIRRTERQPKLLPMPLPTGVDPVKASAVVDLCHALLNSAEFLYVE
jgi:hypothetical protein